METLFSQAGSYVELLAAAEKLIQEKRNQIYLLNKKVRLLEIDLKDARYWKIMLTEISKMSVSQFWTWLSEGPNETCIEKWSYIMFRCRLYITLTNNSSSEKPFEVTIKGEFDTGLTSGVKETYMPDYCDTDYLNRRYPGESLITSFDSEYAARDFAVVWQHRLVEDHKIEIERQLKIAELAPF